MASTLPEPAMLNCSCAVRPASAAPGGMFMQVLICATSPSRALCDRVADLPVVLPSVGSPPCPVTAPRDFSELMSSATWSAGLACLSGCVLAWSVCFLGVSAFFGVTSAVLTGVGLGGAFCSSTGLLIGSGGAVCACGASLAVSVATSFCGCASSGAGIGVGAATGCGSGTGVGCGASTGLGAVLTTGAGVDLSVCCGDGWSSSVLPAFCASWAGVSVLTTVLCSEPARILVKSEIGTRSTAIDSSTSGSTGLAEPSPMITMIRRAAWAMTEVVTPVFIALFRLVLGLCRDQPDLGETARAERPHHLHHGAVVGALVAAHIDALVGGGAVRRLRVDGIDEPVDIDRLVAQIDVARRRHRHGDRLALGVELLGLGLRQVDRHADREQRRRHHEHDEQHQHHIDHRRDVDVGHRAL